MKLGKTSHVITAYAALFTIAIGVLAWDFARRSTAREEQPMAQQKAASGKIVLVAR
ncbi:MAG: hypothetical protein ABMA13_10505 [Chthoniobacteraceae bacterium]